MPWKEVTAMDEKIRFIQTYLDHTGSFGELCQYFGITRTTGYKYLKKYKEQGLKGLNELSRKPKSSPLKTEPQLEQAILSVRHLHPAWAGEKIKNYLSRNGFKKLPTEKTIDRILKRNGLITAEESEKHKAWIRFEHENPNDLWQMDFKGHFEIGTGRCHPLTILDDHSRFSILIKGCANEQGNTVKTELIKTFQEYGLPLRMTMDNGSPWGGAGAQRHTWLTAWLIQLGIIVSHSRPKHPQTQGKLERFHRTLKLELLTRFSFEDMQEAQEGFDWWRRIYNEQRPHAAIDNSVPNERYTKSIRAYPSHLPPVEYDSEMQIRKVQWDGCIHFSGKRYLVGSAFHRQKVGVKESNDDGVYEVYFCKQRIVKIDLRDVA